METTIATREEQKQEAIARMRYLKLYPQVIKEFEKEELVNLLPRRDPLLGRGRDV